MQDEEDRDVRVGYAIILAEQGSVAVIANRRG